MTQSNPSYHQMEEQKKHHNAEEKGADIDR